MKERKKILTMLVENNYGVTSRVSGMFSRRGFNLDSFTGCDTLDPRFSRITVVVHGDDGLDEITLTTTTKMTILKNGQITHFTFEKCHNVNP